MRRFWVTVTAVALAAMTGHVAMAALTETGETGLVTLPTTGVLAPLKPAAGVYLNGPVDSADGVELHATKFSLGIGLIDNLELTAEIPFVQFEGTSPGRRHIDDVGGLRIGMKYRLLNEDEGAPLSAALLGAVVLGTGRDSFPVMLDRNSAFGKREVYEVMGIVDKHLFTLENGAQTTMTVNAGGLFFDRPETFSVLNQTHEFQRRFRGPNATFDTPFEFGFGLDIGLLNTKAVQLSLLEEFRGNTGIVDELQGSLPTFVFTGGRMQVCNGIAAQAGAEFGMSGFLDPHRYIVGLTYAMPAAAPAPAPVVQAAAPPPPPPPPAKQKIVLRGVHFDFDKATLRPDSLPVLKEAAATLEEHAEIAVVVEGHTDSRGTEAYNQRLSVRRAQAVRDELVKLGVDAKRLRVRGKGESQPVASNTTDDGRAQNRRVELLVVR